MNIRRGCKVKDKIIALYGIPVGFLLLGFLFLIIGANGEGLASFFSRPPGAMEWSISNNAIKAFNFVPTVLGITFLILFVSTFSISFYTWQKNVLRDIDNETVKG